MSGLPGVQHSPIVLEISKKPYMWACILMRVRRIILCRSISCICSDMLMLSKNQTSAFLNHPFALYVGSGRLRKAHYVYYDYQVTESDGVQACSGKCSCTSMYLLYLCVFYASVCVMQVICQINSKAKTVALLYACSCILQNLEYIG